MTHTDKAPQIAYPYVLPQVLDDFYTDDDAIIRGTLFPELDLPFQKFENRRHLPKTPLTNIMTLDFVCHELRLYLDTHPEDSRAYEFYRNYQKKSAEAKAEALAPGEQYFYNTWVYDPWPWEGEDM